MNTLAHRLDIAGSGPRAGRPGTERFIAGICAGLAALVTIGGCTRGAPGWVVMWTVAIVEFLLLKFATLQGIGRGVPPWKVGAYLGLWPGMSARRFLHPSPAAEKRPRLRELLFAIAKLVLGIVL